MDDAPEALEKNSKQPRPIILDFYTDWCGWCKHMMRPPTPIRASRSTSTPTSTRPSSTPGKGHDRVPRKKYLPSGPEPKAPHELAVELLKGQLMYPSTLFLNGYEPEKNAFRLNMLAPGYLDAQKIEPILVYTLENAFRNASIDDFRDQYQKAFYDSTTEDGREDAPWIDAFVLQQPERREKEITGVHQHRMVQLLQGDGPRELSWDSLRTYLLDKFNLVGFNAEQGHHAIPGQGVPRR